MELAYKTEEELFGLQNEYKNINNENLKNSFWLFIPGQPLILLILTNFCSFSHLSGTGF